MAALARCQVRRGQVPPGCDDQTPALNFAERGSIEPVFRAGTGSAMCGTSAYSSPTLVGEVSCGIGSVQLVADQLAVSVPVRRAARNLPPNRPLCVRLWYREAIEVSD